MGDEGRKSGKDLKKRGNEKKKGAQMSGYETMGP